MSLLSKGIEKTTNPPTDLYWCRWSYRTISEDLSSLKSENKIYTTNGILTIQIFGPLQDERSQRRIQQLADGIKKIFRGHSTSDSIWFRGSGVAEMSANENWNNSNVIVNYQYDETGE